MIGGLGFGEVVFVLVIILVLFGPNKIPELARAVGGALGEFKTAQKAAEFDLSGFDELNRQNAEKKKQEAAALNEKIIKMAEDADISAEGKTTDELLVLIAAKMNEVSSENSDVVESCGGNSESNLVESAGGNSESSSVESAGGNSESESKSETNDTAPAEDTVKAEA